MVNIPGSFGGMVNYCSAIEYLIVASLWTGRDSYFNCYYALLLNLCFNGFPCQMVGYSNSQYLKQNTHQGAVAKKGSHVYFLLEVFWVILLFCQILLLSDINVVLIVLVGILFEVLRIVPHLPLRQNKMTRKNRHVANQHQTLWGILVKITICGSAFTGLILHIFYFLKYLYME